MCSESRKYPDAFSFQVVAETDWRKFNFVAGMVSMMKSLMKEVITCLFSNEGPYEFWPKVPKLTVRFRPLEICVENSGGSRISPRRGRQLPGGAPTYDFDKFSQKMHEIERIWAPPP